MKIHKGLWEGFAENLLDAATLLHSCGVLLVCRSCLRDMWDALPWANHEAHETAWTKRNRQVLHKAESVTVGRTTVSAMPQLSVRSRDLGSIESDLTTPLLHTYWGMGLPMQHSQVAALVIRFGNSERSRRVIANILEPTGVTPCSLESFRKRKPKNSDSGDMLICPDR